MTTRSPSRFFTAPLKLAFIVSALAAAAGCFLEPSTGVQPSCASGPGQCVCQTSAFELPPETQPTDSCDDLGSAATWLCNYDLDSNGDSSVCECVAYGCSNLSENECACGFGGGTSSTCATTQPMSEGAITCCAETSPSAWSSTMCICQAGTTCSSALTSPMEVTSCDGTPPGPVPAPTTGQVASSCAGLDWVDGTSD